MDEQEIQRRKERFIELVDKHSNIVFFGGAGVSTESGIPDFRSAEGIFTTSGLKNPEEIVSRSFFDAHTDEFYDFYRNTMIYPDTKPNQAHRKLAELEHEGRLKMVITQNVDGLHQMAGSKNVVELHGSIHRNLCMQCGRQFDMDYVLQAQGVPRCDSCSGIVKPDVVLYEEALNSNDIATAIAAISSADMLIIAGTSLVVYPAAAFIDYFKGDCLVIINKSPTSADSKADLLIPANVGMIMDW